MNQNYKTFSPDEAMQLAEQLKAEGQPGEAEAMLRQVLAAVPNYHPAYHTLGLIAYEAGNMPLAVELIGKAIFIDNEVALYHRNAGEMCRRLGRLSEAVMFARRACELAPDELDAHYNLGLALTDQCEWEASILAYRRALKLNPNHGLSWNNLGAALEKQGNLVEAEAAYAKAVAINPSHKEAQNNLGAICSEQGRLEEAVRCFENSIKADPDFTEPHFNLSTLKTYTKDDPHLHYLERNRGRAAAMPDFERIRYWFALGKAREDAGLYDGSFAAYAEGNRLQHALMPCDEAHSNELMARIQAVFTREFFDARTSSAPPLSTFPPQAGERANEKSNVQSLGSDKAPVFIVGMPRSGTSLLEQILSSHPSVHGAGELLDLSEVIMSAQGNGGQRFPDFVPGLGLEEFARLGEAYAERVWKLAPDALRITDKMPANFIYIGMIRLMLPNAKIIHSMRDPMDSCFSCYSRLFSDTMDFTYDLGTLGRYYARYIKLMRHWHNVLPAGAILDLHYEELVADTEGQARRVLDYLELPWDDNCLAFHKNKRHVKTASVAQVRKPIYQTSVARWRHFAPHLTPLLDIVQPYRDTVEPEAPLLDRALRLQAKEEHEAALKLIDEATTQGDDSAQLHHLRFISLYKLGRLHEALESCSKALALQPDFPQALNSMGFVLQDLDRLEEAREHFARALQLAPDFDMARLNLGMLQIKLGDWQAGWENYEVRWTGSRESTLGDYAKPACPLPQWRGEFGTQSQNLLVITEQGFGDTFMFSRYLLLALERFAKVGFVCSTPTLRLMASSFGDRVILMPAMPADLAAWHWQCPLMSLPRSFGSRVDNVPASVPYLSADAQAVSYWDERLAQACSAKARIGIAWSGRKAHQYDARRSVKFEQLLPLLRDERFSWVSLQKWGDGEEKPLLPADVHWLDWTDELADFADTAALVSNLDLVITIDSSMAHLAGALNTPVWLMNRFDCEWRWLRGRKDSIWYPSMSIFNQPAFGDWESVMDEVTRALKKFPAKHKATPRKIEKANTAPVAPQAQQLSVEQAMALANQHQSQGNLPEAEHLLRQILQAQPQHAFALHLLGVIAHQAGKPELAIELIQKAVQSNGQVALFHANLGEMCRMSGKPDEAVTQGELAVALDDNLASAHSNLGIAYFDQKDYERAFACQTRALAIEPNFAPALNNMGSICHAKKDRSAAIDWFQRAALANPAYLEPLSNLGAVLQEEDRSEEAVAVIEKALRINPNYAEALCNLGMVRNSMDQYDIALPLFLRAIELRPEYTEAYVGLASSYAKKENFDEAEICARRALELAPAKADVYCQLGSVYVAMAFSKEAEAMYRRALEIDPESNDAFLGLGNLSMEDGDMLGAESLFRKVLNTDPDSISARFYIAQSRKVKAGDENLLALEAIAHGTRNKLTNKNAMTLHFGLGKCYDDSGQYDKSFLHFIEGCRLKRASFYYDADEVSRHFDSIMQVFDKKMLQRLSGGGDPSRVPIFVLGMPRSGTTLTEQIIASHPDVYGAGELPDMLSIAHRMVAGKAYPQSMQELKREQLSAWGADYVAGLQKRAPDARHITDKMPANFYAVGLIHLMLPNAKIIHVNRNPVDTCLSCFTRWFNQKQENTYDLAELGRYYVDYARLMQHWRNVLPAGSFLDVQYEEIVTDQEGQARRMLDYCGLEWNDACIDFYKNKRAVRTASVTQVRQPIYNTSVEKWRHYEKHLGPLLDALGDLV
jgi:tetratricopeptide (TPR) repeat protein